MSKEQVGCCGAYCGTCPEMQNNRCKGCKIGYQNGARDISKAKCKVKVCCIPKGFDSCADCHEFNTCEIIASFHNKNGYKYKKYKEALEFIKSSGYIKFLKVSSTWSRQYGKYK